MKHCYIFIFIFCGYLNSNAQDVNYYNLHQSLTNLNPSFAGSNGGIRYQSGLRLSNMNSKYNNTILNGFDIYIKELKGGISLSHTYRNYNNNDEILNKFSLSYAQHISFFKEKLKVIPSFQANYFKEDLNYNYLNNFYYDNNKEGVNFTFGLLINYKHFYIGVTAFNLSKYENYSFIENKKYKLIPQHLKSFYTSYNVVLPKLSFHFFASANNNHAQIGLNSILFKHYILGGALTGDANPIYKIGYKHNYFNVVLAYNQYRFMYGNYKLNTWEFSAGFNLRNKENRVLITDLERW